MKILLVYCHPNPESFTAAVKALAVETLQRAGHEVEIIDLYAEGFDPVMSRDERAGYHTRGENRVPVATHLDRVQRRMGCSSSTPPGGMRSPRCSRAGSNAC